MSLKYGYDEIDICLCHYIREGCGNIMQCYLRLFLWLAIFINATWHIKATVLICKKKKNPLSREVPMGFVLISLHPYDYIHHNWFWQNIHTGECQQNIVFLNFKYLQEYFAAKSMLVKELEMSFYQGRESLRKFKWMGMN